MQNYVTEFSRSALNIQGGVGKGEFAGHLIIYGLPIFYRIAVGSAVRAGIAADFWSALFFAFVIVSAALRFS